MVNLPHETPTFLESLLTRGERITMWLMLGVGVGAWKAGEWMEEGVPQNVALFVGVIATTHVLMIVALLWEMLTTSVRVYRRLWPSRKRLGGS